MNRRKFGALVLLAFMVLSVSACTNIDANKESVDEAANVVSTGVDSQVVEESTNSINEAQTNESDSSNNDVSIVTSDTDKSEVDIEESKDISEENSSTVITDNDIKNTELMKYMSSLRSKLESGKKVNIRVNDASEVGEMTYYMVDKKVVVETKSSGMNIISIADGNKIYVVMGDYYYETETNSDILDNLFVISEDNADEMTFVNKENGYEYFNIEDDYSLIAKVDGDDLVVYKGSLKNEYLRFTVSTVTVDDIVKADLTKYKKVSLSDLALSMND